MILSTHDISKEFWYLVFFFVLGAIWCGSVFSRLGKDIGELRQPGNQTGKAVILFFWIATVAVLIGMGYIVADYVIKISRYF